MKLSVIFKERPEQWGFRGDPYFWDHLKKLAENMEIITKEGQQINRYTPSESQDGADGRRGKRVGIAYELENGEIIYVPE